MGPAPVERSKWLLGDPRSGGEALPISWRCCATRRAWSNARRTWKSVARQYGCDVAEVDLEFGASTSCSNQAFRHVRFTHGT
eukprot:5729548-Prorocentrum_lima.AAC.1